MVGGTTGKTEHRPVQESTRWQEGLGRWCRSWGFQPTVATQVLSADGSVQTCAAVGKKQIGRWAMGRGEDAESVLEINPGLPGGCSALVPSSQYGDGRNRNSLIKTVTDPQRLPYRERWKSLGLLHLMKS